MTDITLIKKYLSENLWELAIKFDISEDFLRDMPEIIEMILNSKSIDSIEEKQNWFNLLPLMNNDQIGKLKEILNKEVIKLQEIEDKYEKKKNEIKKRYLVKWQQMGYIKQINAIHNEEEIAKSQDDIEAEELLLSI